MRSHRLERYFQDKGNKEEKILEIGEWVSGYQHNKGTWLGWGLHCRHKDQSLNLEHGKGPNMRLSLVKNPEGLFKSCQ